MKYVLAILLTFFYTCLLSDDQPVWMQEYYNNNNNITYVRVINTTNYNLQCYIRPQKGQILYFYVSAYSNSNWYVKPYGYYEWRCN